MKSISIIISFSYDTDEIKIFDNRKWLIALGIITFLLINIFVAYLYCNEKYYLEKGIISISDYMFYYGMFGIILASICIIISTYAPCGDETLPELSKIICSVKDENENYYLTSYIISFKNFSKEYLGLRIFFLVIYSILIYIGVYYSYVVYKILSPIYQICMFRLNLLILTILDFINDLTNDKIEGISITLYIFEILILIFYLIGSIVYLEFIELNFCNLNFYLKKNIKIRAKADTRISLTSINSDNNDDEAN